MKGEPMFSVEHQIAVAFMSWWALSCRRLGLDERMLFAIPNGGHRHPAVAAKLKAEGVRAGVSDYFLAVPLGLKHGLFLELKAGGPGIKKGRPTKEQIEFGNQVEARLYDFRVAYGTNEAIEAVAQYLGIKA
jgi:hypothetical protein